MLDYQSPFPVDGVKSGTAEIQFVPVTQTRIMQCATWDTDLSAACTAIASALGTNEAPPITAGHCHQHQDIALFAIAPGRIWCVGNNNDSLLATWPADQVTEHVAWADLSDNYAVLKLIGNRAFRLLSKATTIAFSDKIFTENSVCKTVIRPSISTVIRRLPDTNNTATFELYIPRSYTRSACNYLSDLTTNT